MTEKERIGSMEFWYILYCLGAGFVILEGIMVTFDNFYITLITMLFMIGIIILFSRWAKQR